MNQKIDYLVDLYFFLLDMAKNSCYDQKQFREKSDEYGKRFQRLTVEQQGEVSHLVVERLMRM